MSLIEKIDAEIEETKKIRNGESRSAYLQLDGMVSGLKKAKQIFISEQEKPCGFCKNSKSIKYHGVTEKLNDGTTITISGDTEAIRCPMCGRLLNQPSIDTE